MKFSTAAATFDLSHVLLPHDFYFIILLNILYFVVCFFVVVVVKGAKKDFAPFFCSIVISSLSLLLLNNKVYVRDASLTIILYIAQHIHDSQNQNNNAHSSSFMQYVKKKQTKSYHQISFSFYLALTRNTIYNIMLLNYINTKKVYNNNERNELKNNMFMWISLNYNLKKASSQ